MEQVEPKRANMKKMTCLSIMCVLFVLITITSFQAARAEVMLQWFETEWDEMYRRIPEVAEIGYDYIWTPPPTKAPTGLGTKWGNVGYSLYDRFDIGDVPQRGSYATRYGTRGSLNNMVKNMHQCDVKIIPDIVMNHNGNGPDIRYYPGMRVNDFHVWAESGYCNSLDYKRAPRMTQWSADNGYGGTMYEDLCSLIDIRTEDNEVARDWSLDPNRFTAPNGPQFIDGDSFIRHIGQIDKYPYPADYSTPEDASDMLYRWIAWLGDAMDYDGLRLDAGKHTPWEFFGQPSKGFLHEAQYNFSLRRGYDYGDNRADLYGLDLIRTNALIFAEILSPWSEIRYWADNGNAMRFLDYQIKKAADSALNGNIGNFFMNDFGEYNGIMYVWGHDEGPASKVDLGYAYTLTHIGLPMVYFTGKNIEWSDKGTRTWMIPGYDGYALSDDGGKIANLVWINAQFARGAENNLWHDGDFLALERYDSTKASNQGTLVAAFNDSGWDQTKTLSGLHFNDGTVLHDYTGNNPSDVTVNSGSADFTVPGMSGQGWVCYAPRNADGVEDTLQYTQDGSPCPTMTWIVPGGEHGSDKTRQLTRVTGTNLQLNVFFDPVGGPVDSVMLKWGQGKTKLTPTNYWGNSDFSLVSGHFEKLNQTDTTNWYMDIQITETNIPEGLNVVKARVFNQRSDTEAAIYNTFTEVIYVDRRGPELDIAHPAEGSSINGTCVMLITNKDFTAYGMTVALDGGSAESAHEVMKGLWKFNLAGLSAGIHTAVVTATEADWGSPRSIINTSVYTRTFNVVANANTISLSHSEGAEKQLPFFLTAVDVGGASPDDVRLYWNGYELPFNGGHYTNSFNGEVIFRDDIGNVETNRLWGNFVNGQNFFEAMRVDGGVTSHASARVLFNLYGINAIDSDGDSIPDNVEMPFIDSDGAPGADAPWPGDSNQNFIPESWESWTRLNPYNHSTFYSGQWDDRNDFDGDGYNNYEEVYAGYLQGNIYLYSIYDSSQTPTGFVTNAVSSVVVTSPTYPARDSLLSIQYTPNEGPLESADPVVLHVGHSKRTLGSWQDVISITMTNESTTNWVCTYLVPTNATSVDFVFRDDSAATWDNNNGADWQVTVQGSVPVGFVMDGTVDSEDYKVLPYNQTVYAAVKGSDFYIAVSPSNGYDTFVYVTDEPGDALASPWEKSGFVFFNTSTKPFITKEGDNGWRCWNNITGSLDTNQAHALIEGSFSMLDAFGYVPDALYVAAVAYGTNPGDGIAYQTPYVWNGGDDLDVMEFQRLDIDSIRDDDGNGQFDAGSPSMITYMNGDSGGSSDANYGLRRFFINELANELQYLTVTLTPNPGGTNAVSAVELFSNLNRRDYAVLPGDEVWDDITPTSMTNYYRSYSMTNNGDGTYSYTIPVFRCGAYRVNARYKVNNGEYAYYTDNALRRDCAVVVSPTKTLDVVMYELNPMIAEAQDSTFFGRSTFEDMYVVNTTFVDRVSTSSLNSLGVNMIWLQPIHPIGSENRQDDPETGNPYDPGSPYAVRNYWTINSVLGDPSSESNAMIEFADFVGAMDDNGVGIMLDGTFNHSAWDCEVGQVGVDMFDWATNATDLIRDIQPGWYSREGYYNLEATHYFGGSNKDVAEAPDRIDFGKWSDACDFYFGVYDCLVQEGPTQTNWAWASKWYHRYLFEEDRFYGFESNATRELWEYFTYYPIYWLEQTGHPVGTPKSESHKGIDGLRCDFAQGLPSDFWEYCINKTRCVKWDFLFMAESLDGSREVGGSSAHGVGYRSSRHFDILNENMVYYWRDNFFQEFKWGQAQSGTPDRRTSPTKEALDDRKTAFANVPILLNLTSHDEILPSAHQPSLLYAYATVCSVAGVPLIMYGQEAGAQNDAETYTNTLHWGYSIDAANNFDKYEMNFGKSIPNFKRYNNMTSVWNQGSAWMAGLRSAYGRISKARTRSPALRSQNEYFLSQSAGGYDEDIFAIAKFEAPGVSAASQDVVFAFVNNNCQASSNRANLFNLDADFSGQNWFGIIEDHYYNVVDITSETPTNYLWSPSKPGLELITNGIYVGLNDGLWEGAQAQFLKLIDTGATYPTDADGNYNGSVYGNWDWDGDGMENSWEAANGLDPNSATGVNGADGDRDDDGMSNYDEYVAGTNPDDPSSILKIDIAMDGTDVNIMWDSVPYRNYRVQYATSLHPGPVNWRDLYFGTAMNTNAVVAEDVGFAATNRFYRTTVQP
ncbi:MAG: hypothetical protein EOM20_06690 [Spartobacteria bacterium]|nr:hypothetical protein [Spartobacteria bacterium]